MSMRKAALALAPTLIGMTEDQAEKAIFKARCAYRFIVLSGEPCGRNTDQDNSTICLFSDKAGKITRAVVGTRGVYELPRCDP